MKRGREEREEITRMYDIVRLDRIECVDAERIGVTCVGTDKGMIR